MSTDCLQQAILKALPSLSPEDVYNNTGYIKDKWTWPFKALHWLHTLGYNIIIIDPDNYESFSNNPHTYIKEHYGEEVYKQQLLFCY